MWLNFANAVVDARGREKTLDKRVPNTHQRGQYRRGKYMCLYICVYNYAYIYVWTSRMRESTSGAERRDLISASQIHNCEGNTGGVNTCVYTFVYTTNPIYMFELRACVNRRPELKGEIWSARPKYSTAKAIPEGYIYVLTHSVTPSSEPRGETSRCSAATK